MSVRRTYDPRAETMSVLPYQEYNGYGASDFPVKTYRHGPGTPTGLGGVYGTGGMGYTPPASRPASAGPGGGRAPGFYNPNQPGMLTPTRARNSPSPSSYPPRPSSAPLAGRNHSVNAMKYMDDLKPNFLGPDGKWMQETMPMPIAAAQSQPLTASPTFEARLPGSLGKIKPVSAVHSYLDVSPAVTADYIRVPSMPQSKYYSARRSFTPPAGDRHGVLSRVAGQKQRAWEGREYEKARRRYSDGGYDSNYSSNYAYYEAKNDRRSITPPPGGRGGSGYDNYGYDADQDSTYARRASSVYADSTQAVSGYPNNRSSAAGGQRPGHIFDAALRDRSPGYDVGYSSNQQYDAGYNDGNQAYDAGSYSDGNQVYGAAYSNGNKVYDAAYNDGKQNYDAAYDGGNQGYDAAYGDGYQHNNTAYNSGNQVYDAAYNNGNQGYNDGAYGNANQGYGGAYNNGNQVYDAAYNGADNSGYSYARTKYANRSNGYQPGSNAPYNSDYYSGGSENGYGYGKNINGQYKSGVPSNRLHRANNAGQYDSDRYGSGRAPVRADRAPYLSTARRAELRKLRQSGYYGTSAYDKARAMRGDAYASESDGLGPYSRGSNNYFSGDGGAYGEYYPSNGNDGLSGQSPPSGNASYPSDPEYYPSANAYDSNLDAYARQAAPRPGVTRTRSYYLDVEPRTSNDTYGHPGQLVASQFASEKAGLAVDSLARKNSVSRKYSQLINASNYKISDYDLMRTHYTDLGINVVPGAANCKLVGGRWRYVPRPVDGDVLWTDYYGPFGKDHSNYYGRKYHDVSDRIY